MTYPTITLTKLSQTRKPGTKTVWQTDKTEVDEISEEQYNNCVEAAPFFRRMGGSESLTREYTSWGYKVTQIISTSPDREARSIFKFDFKYS